LRGAVVLFSKDSPVNLIRRIRPDVLVKGSDYRMNQVLGREEVEAHGGKVVLVDFLAGETLFPADQPHSGDCIRGSQKIMTKTKFNLPWNKKIPFTQRNHE
jgi:hypothetical protein